MSGSIATVDRYMARDLVTFRPTDDVLVAVRILLEKRLSGAPVVDRHGRLVGVLSKKDCLNIVFSTAYHQDMGGYVEDYMSSEVRHIESGTDIVTAAELFMDSRFRRFPIMKNGRLVGQISRYDILLALEESWSGSTGS